jgi:hypothetical protein
MSSLILADILLEVFCFYYANIGIAYMTTPKSCNGDVVVSIVLFYFVL